MGCFEALAASKPSKQKAQAAHLQSLQWAVACAIAQNGSHFSVAESSDAVAAGEEAAGEAAAGEEAAGEEAPPALSLLAWAACAVCGVFRASSSARPPAADGEACKGHASLESKRAGQKEQACGGHASMEQR
jgi:hypothetical protein